jgi:hypothetical protein
MSPSTAAPTAIAPLQSGFLGGLVRRRLGGGVAASCRHFDGIKGGFIDTVLGLEGRI